MAVTQSFEGFFNLLVENFRLI